MPPVALRFLAFIVIAVAGYGCTDVGERGFKSSDSGVMEELEAELKKEGIPFHRDSDGFLTYNAQSEDIVRRLIAEVERKLNGGIAVKYDDKISRDFMKQLLTSKGLEFRIENRIDGEWIRWYPENEAQKNEIEMKVVEHYFAIQRQRQSSECEPRVSPSNNSLNKDAAHARRTC